MNKILLLSIACCLIAGNASAERIACPPSISLPASVSGFTLHKPFPNPIVLSGAVLTSDSKLRCAYGTKYELGYELDVRSKGTCKLVGGKGTDNSCVGPGCYLSCS